MQMKLAEERAAFEERMREQEQALEQERQRNKDDL